jgi:hypothetical protein
MTARGEIVTNTLIGLIIFCWIVYGMKMSHRGHGYGRFFQRFLQNTFSCCAVEPDGDIEKASEMTDGEPRLSMMTMRMKDLEMGREINRDKKCADSTDVVRGPWPDFQSHQPRFVGRNDVVVRF